MTNLLTFKLGNEIYITSIQYVEYEDKLKLILYSKESNFSLYYCMISYKHIQEKCKMNLLYRNDYYYLNLFEISTSRSINPISLMLNNISVAIPKSKRNIKYNFVSCYSIMSNFNRPLLLTQLIESNLYFGVKKIIIYYYSSSKKVRQILKYYIEKGFVDVYKFHSDNFLKSKESSRDIKIYHLILFKMNHCFNEYKTKSNHMLFLDLDEIFWPSKSVSYDKLIRSIPQHEFYYVYASFFKLNINISEKLDKNTTLILPDTDIFSINEYCQNDDGYIRKYIILDTNKFIATLVHGVVSKDNISGSYISNEIAFIRHTRHFNNGLKLHCPSKKLQKRNLTNIEKAIKINSIQAYNTINFSI